MLSLIRPAIVSTVFFTLVLGLAYPLGVTAIANAAMPAKAQGSLIKDKAGKVIGSALIGQTFTGAGYLHPRPSAAGKGYDASASSGSNYGPMNPDYAARVKTDADALKSDGPGPIPVDAVTTSGSGLDPDISPANAERQIARIARARGVSEDAVRTIVGRHLEQPLLGFIGQPHVNVLETNLALDAGLKAAQPPAS